MTEPNSRSRARGCGFQAALGFLILIGLPVLFVFAFGNAPCKDGPCNPNGAADLGSAAITLGILALLIGGIVWWLVDRRDQRQPPGSSKGRSPVALAAGLLLLMAAGFLVYVIVG